MFNPLSSLKARMFRPPSLAEGTEFTLGGMAGATVAEADTRWRVATVRMLRGIPHAMIEQMATGVKKTIAVSALMSNPAIQFVAPGRI
jgi:hypothetical protein